MSTLRRWSIMGILSISGGIIFMLPFLQEVFYIPLAQALGLSNTQVGSLMSIFGAASLIAYFPGGWLADRVSPRKLITSSLISTGAAGLYFSTFPSYEICLAIHAFWGVSIAFLFWGALIRLTRSWAPPEDQGKAFGILETGRGIGEALPSSAFVVVFAVMGSGDRALSSVIVQYSVVFLLLGVLAWFILEDTVDEDRSAEAQPKIGLHEVIAVLKMPVVWLITTVIFAGYTAYWGLFRYTSLATDIFALSVTFGAALSTAKMWLKPLAALIAGFVADRFGIAKSVTCLFVVLIASYAIVAVLPGQSSFIPVMLINLAVASMAVYAMRGIYFALLDEGGVPLAVTGTATGVISAIAFTPDVFMPLLGGVLLDRFPGAPGYRYFFSTTAAICVVGLFASLIIYFRIVRTRSGAT